MKNLIILFLATVYITNAYVLLQVRKGENESNVDALIHKVIPSNKVDSFTNKIARKHFMENKNQKENDIDDIILQIETGVEPKKTQAEKKSNFVDNIVTVLKNYASKPQYRAKEYDIKPEIIHFRSDKPSLKFEINSKTIIKALRDIVGSKTFKQYADVIAKKAAVVYRSIRREIEGQSEK